MTDKPQRFKTGKYAGNKWGGKYLRAPDIFYTILEKGAMTKLSDLSEVYPGCYSGINDFFYLDKERTEKYAIEPEYFKPLIRSSDIIDKLKVINTKDNYVLAMPNISKAEIKKLSHNGVRSYIEWGEKQVTRKRQKTDAGIPWPNVESVKTRRYWYSIPAKNLIPTNLFMQYVSNDRFYCPFSDEPFVSDRCFHRLFVKESINFKELSASLNSSLQMFFVMLFGRSNLGEGALKFEAADAKNVITFDIRKLDKNAKKSMVDKLEKLGKREPLSVFEEIGINLSKPIYDQIPNPLPDRAELDNIIFDELGLTKEERKEVYWSVCELVKQRLDKAGSFKDE